MLKIWGRCFWWDSVSITCVVRGRILEDDQQNIWRSCSPLLRGNGPETASDNGLRDTQRSCSPLLRGDGPETTHRYTTPIHLAVPSYGAMALKHHGQLRPHNRPGLAVPSYGAMALKHHGQLRPHNRPGLAVPSYGAMALKPPMVIDTIEVGFVLQSPPTGRWP